MALSMLKIPAICMQSHRSQREAFSSAFTAGAAFNPPGSRQQPTNWEVLTAAAALPYNFTWLRYALLLSRLCRAARQISH